MSATSPTSLAARINGVRHGDAGMATAEYAVGTVAACGMGGVLYKVITSDAVSSLLSGLLEKALSWVF